MGGEQAGEFLPGDTFRLSLSSFEKFKNGGGGGGVNDAKNFDNTKCDLFNDERKSNESLTISPEVGIAQSFDGCALRSRKSVLIAAKVRAHENGD